VKKDSQPQSGESLKESNPKMKEILITTPAEIKRTKKKFGVGLLLMLGELLNSYDKHIY